ncbi:hypothetical protein V8G54_031005 [Vigna mungo]|uniref:NADP-dependent oxidoreductase domain-containing protein n=1 Tax=Vigna mungo TaxID=3915 RepID=A0AAQ3MXT8_VIGMU
MFVFHAGFFNWSTWISTSSTGPLLPSLGKLSTPLKYRDSGNARNLVSPKPLESATSPSAGLKNCSLATIPPAVNQVEVNLGWQQQQLREFCKEKDITVTAFSPLRNGASRGANLVMDNDILKELSDAHGKTVAQSYDKDRMKQNLGIFDWSLTEEDYKKIAEIHQDRLIKGPTKPLLDDLWE